MTVPVCRPRPPFRAHSNCITLAKDSNLRKVAFGAHIAQFRLQIQLIFVKIGLSATLIIARLFVYNSCGLLRRLVQGIADRHFTDNGFHGVRRHDVADDGHHLRMRRPGYGVDDFVPI